MFAKQETFLMAMLLCTGGPSACAVTKSENRLVLNSLDRAANEAMIRQ